ncbi:hypothetical protein [Flaviflexus massiliensis]|uniref:hypothetical protein n=1 Tax=Flaviflexus massiliensis TaxID=1522309 RepID=UPI00097DEEE0|nr:hypothetical protein [Flaviflexus massiliensis]
MEDMVAVDREALGISAIQAWTDAETLANIASGIQPVINVIGPSISELPAGRMTGGVVDLRNMIGCFLETMLMVINEYSDAAALLGSGQEEAMLDYDATENDASSAFDFLTQETGG